MKGKRKLSVVRERGSNKKEARKQTTDKNKKTKKHGTNENFLKRNMSLTRKLSNERKHGSNKSPVDLSIEIKLAANITFK